MLKFGAFLTEHSKACLFAFALLVYPSPLLLGHWVAQLAANFYGLCSAFLLAFPFFSNDWIKKSRQQALTAVVRGSANVLKEGQLKRLDRLSTSWTPFHLHMMQVGLTLLAVSYLLFITTMLLQAMGKPAAT
jgi:hypothetical protein